MENKVLFNIEKIKGFKMYFDYTDIFWTHIPKNTERWWKLFGFIPLFKYKTKEDKWRYHIWGDTYNRQQMSTELDTKYIINENNQVVKKPFICIWFENDETTIYGASIEKTFETKDAAIIYFNKLKEICYENKIILQNSDLNYEN